MKKEKRKCMEMKLVGTYDVTIYDILLLNLKRKEGRSIRNGIIGRKVEHYTRLYSMRTTSLPHINLDVDRGPYDRWSFTHSSASSKVRSSLSTSIL